MRRVMKESFNRGLRGRFKGWAARNGVVRFR